MQGGKYNIAFTGVFDIENYGDHLFPIAFETAMKKRGLEFEMFLFSCFECEQAFNSQKHVFALQDLEDMHNKIKFDAIVVGGGEIIHLHSFKHKRSHKDEEYIQYPIYQTWIIPSMVSEKYGISLLWNNPGIPFEFEGFYQRVAKKFLWQVDYLSVRNSFSVDALLACNISKTNISLHPDSAFILPEIFEKSALISVNEKLLEKNSSYIVFHCNHLINESHLKTAVENLINLHEQGYQIVLLPLAYTNADDEIAEKINELANNKFVTFKEKLSLEQIVSVLAHCKLYIGVSFHGAITTYCYDGKVIGFDFFKNKKTKDLFDMLGIPENYITEADDLRATIDNVLRSDKDVSYYKEKIKLSLNEHFENLITHISNNDKKEKENVNKENVYQEISNLLADISCDFQKCSEEKYVLHNEVFFFNEKWKACAEHLDHTTTELEHVKKKINELESAFGKAANSRFLKRAAKFYNMVKKD